jgi:antitoxin component of MazEF toxin-antitoxin module
MSEVFDAKVRKVGTSLGILIPNEQIIKENVKEGEILSWGFLREKNIQKALKLKGIDKGAQPFEREEEEDRV